MTVINRRKLLFMLLAFVGSPALAHEDDPHDNEASHGGLLMSHQALHFEVVLARGGGIRIYYSDARQAPLPAATVSGVVVEIERPDRDVETVDMSISASGDHWIGASGPVVDPDTVIHLAFILGGEPVVMALPASEFPGTAHAETVAVLDLIPGS